MAIARKLDTFAAHFLLGESSFDACIQPDAIIEVEHQMERQRCATFAWNLDLRRSLASEWNFPDSFEGLASVPKFQRATQGAECGGGEGQKPAKVLIDDITGINQRRETAACGDGEGIDLDVEVDTDSRFDGRIDSFDNDALGDSLCRASGDSAGGLHDGEFEQSRADRRGRAKF